MWAVSLTSLLAKATIRTVCPAPSRAIARTVHVTVARPWQTRSEYLVDLALESALSATPEELREMRPVAAPIALFPERRGFAKNVWNIMEVMNIDRYNPTRRSWMSGMPVMPSVMSDQSWSGTARNAMSEGMW